MRRKIIPSVISGEQALMTLTSGATACDAAELMAEHFIGAVLVAEGGKVHGIVTERDLVTRVLAKGRDPVETKLEEIMTRDPESVGPNDTAYDALEKMRNGKYRHLPVFEEGELRGIVSIRDLYEAMRQSLEEDLKQAESFIRGEEYGGVPA